MSVAKYPNLDFSYNWNNKLECNYFSTIRIQNHSKFQIGKKFTVRLKSIPLFIAEVVNITSFNLLNITDGMAYIDTGYCKSEAINIIRAMYKAKANQHVYSFIILKKLHLAN